MSLSLPSSSSYNALWLQGNSLVLSILSHSSLVTVEFFCFCCYFLFQFLSYRFKSFGLDAILSSKFIFSSMFDVLPSTFKPILNLIQIFQGSCNIIFNSPFPLRFFKVFLLAIKPTFLHTNLAPAVNRFFSSSKFFTLILQIISLIWETILLTFKASILVVKV